MGLASAAYRERHIRYHASNVIVIALVGESAFLEDHLTINADGAGTVELFVKPYLPPDSISMLRGFNRGSTPSKSAHPPLIDEVVHDLHP